MKSSKTMKKLIFSLFILALLFNCSTDKSDGFTINGTIDNTLDGKKVTLRKFVDRKPVDVDTTRVENGKFTLTGTVDNPDVHFIFVETAMGNLPFILENKELDMTVYKDSMNYFLFEVCIFLSFWVCYDDCIEKLAGIETHFC